jgi:hypothetical protein
VHPVADDEDDDKTDRQALDELAESGANIEQPTAFTHYLYFGDEESARAAHEQLSDQGLEADVTAPDDQVDQWRVFAYFTVVPTEDALAEARGILQPVASEHGGEYDGWDAEVNR